MSSILWFSRLLLLLVVGTTGCGGAGSTVTGRVTYSDGSPVVAGQVLFVQDDIKAKSCVGDIQPDGTFVMFTERLGDGVPPGTYKVGVQPPGDEYNAKNPRPIDMKFADPMTSGLPVCEVKSGVTTHNITIPRPKSGR